MKIKTVVIAVIAVALASVIGLRVLNNDKTTEQPGVSTPQQSAINVSVVKPNLMEFEDIITFVGTVEPQEKAMITSKVTNNVTVLEVYVDVGSEVKKGQPLAKLDDSLVNRQIEEAKAAAAARAAISQAKSQLQTTEKDYMRYKNLYEEQVISRQQLDQIEGQYEVEKAKLEQAQRQLDQAQAQLRQLQIMREYHSIVSPVDGVIAERHIDPGDTVSVGSTCFTVSRQETVKIIGTVTENDYPRIKLGQVAHVKVDAFPNMTFEAEVVRISPILDSVTRSGEVEVWLSSEGILKPGMFARTEVIVGKHEGLSLPREAVKQLPGTGEWYCFVVTPDKKAKQVFVRRGIESGNLVEIIEGLKGEDNVISPVVRAIGDGVSVEVVGQ
ncbi:MAG: efflux RND transporter periplasmic adaptor subunit [Acetomicrobium sp.]